MVQQNWSWEETADPTPRERVLRILSHLKCPLAPAFLSQVLGATFHGNDLPGQWKECAMRGQEMQILLWLCGALGNLIKSFRAYISHITLEMEGHAALYPQSGRTLQDARQSTGTCHSGKAPWQRMSQKNQELGSVGVQHAAAPQWGWEVPTAGRDGTKHALYKPTKGNWSTTLHDPFCSSQSFACNKPTDSLPEVP